MTHSQSRYDILAGYISAGNPALLGIELDKLSDNADFLRRELSTLMLGAVGSNQPTCLSVLLDFLRGINRHPFPVQDYIPIVELALERKMFDSLELLLCRANFSEIWRTTTEKAEFNLLHHRTVVDLFQRPSFTVECLNALISIGCERDYIFPEENDSYMVAAIRLNRSDLVVELLASGGGRSQVLRVPAGKSATPSSIALEQGRIECYRLLIHNSTMPINHPCLPDLPPFVALLRSQSLSEDDLIRVGKELIDLGANPFRVYRLYPSAINAAKSLSLDTFAKALEKFGSSFGPTYVREARRQGIKDLCFFYDKADGLIFRVSDTHFPFFVGGDYDGAYSMDIEAATIEIEKFLTSGRRPDFHTRLKKLLPVLHRIVDDKTTSLSMLVEAM